MNKNFNENFAHYMNREVKHYCKSYDVVIDGKLLENLFFKSFKRMGLSPIWKPESHGVGKDIEIDDALSIKTGGELKGKTPKVIRISSYRTTSHKTLPEKIKYVDEIKNYEYILCCPRRIYSDRIEYIIGYIKADIFKYEDLNWSKKYHKGNFTGYKGFSDDSTITVNINKSQSDQCWETYDLKYFNPIKTISINNDEIGCYYP